ncbi:MAG: hypothetical protein HQK76_10675 [Desulfobacterales bacterium]|nr:hypothetical protein [Desulfobacterales bacterium]
MNKTIFNFFLTVILLITSYVFAEENSTYVAFENAPYNKPEPVGIITNPSIKEASGLASSIRHNNILWVLNDGGNSPLLFALSIQGDTIGTFKIKDVKNIDWEDMASFSLNATAYLMIGDVGDNKAKRKYCSLYIVKEPDIPKNISNKTEPINIEWQIKFKYIDGPRDCEAIAVDSNQKSILLLSKRTKPPMLYELPLINHSKKDILIAQKIANIAHIPEPTKEDLKHRYGKYSSSPTAMDISLDGQIMVILTYKDAYYYEKKAKKEWNEVVIKKPLQIILPLPNTGMLIMREALCIDSRTKEIFITSEYNPAPIFIVRPLLPINKK